MYFVSGGGGESNRNGFSKGCLEQDGRIPIQDVFAFANNPEILLKVQSAKFRVPLAYRDCSDPLSSRAASHETWRVAVRRQNENTHTECEWKHFLLSAPISLDASIDDWKLLTFLKTFARGALFISMKNIQTVMTVEINKISACASDTVEAMTLNLLFPSGCLVVIITAEDQYGTIR